MLRFAEAVWDGEGEMAARDRMMPNAEATEGEREGGDICEFAGNTAKKHRLENSRTQEQTVT